MEPSNSLHNFNLPLTWGKQKLLECRHVYENESDGSDDFNENLLPKNRNKRLGKQSSDDPRRKVRKLNASSGKDVAMSDDDVSDGEDEISVAREKLMGEYNKSEIGKMKETIMKKDANTAIGECGVEINDPQSDKKTTRPRRNQDKKEERPRFSLSLSLNEIEDDFFSMTGKKPPRRPKRRSRAVQAQIKGLFPGSMLSEPHEDRYKV